MPFFESRGRFSSTGEEGCGRLYSRRGRSGKGLTEKITSTVWGDYYSAVKSTVFQADRRNEHEHSAADLDRGGSRVGFGNEIGNDPWSNGAFKSNSTDPVVA